MTPTERDRQRYRNDAMFHRVVHSLWHMMRQAEYSADEMMSAMLIAFELEQDHQRRFMRVRPPEPQAGS